MEQSSHQRDVRLADPTWSLSELMARLAKALASDGPALALAPISSQVVPAEIAIVVNTTGSAGIAKEIGLTASSLLASAKASHSFIGAAPGDRWSLLLPLNHIAGINVLLRSLELGTVPFDFRNRTTGSEGKYDNAEFSAIVPTQLYRALHGDSQLLGHLQGCRAVLVGGAPLTNELRSEAIANQINVIQTYGSTETSGGCIYDGQPLAGVQAQIDESNRLQIKGAVIAHSYLNLAQNLIDENGWHTTSDLAHFADGKIVIEGRSDDVFISGGENISLTSVEQAISAKFPSLEIAAFTVGDSEWGQSLCCAIVNSDSSIESAIQEVLSSTIGEMAKVKRFLYLNEMPLIGIGKVDRAELGRLIK